MTDDYGDDDYRDHKEIGQHELVDGLASLHLFRGGPFMMMQAHNLALVDEFIMDLEAEALAKLSAEDRTPEIAFFLSAQSQMWIFAAYELLRTWRQRARRALLLVQEGKLDAEIAALRKERGYRHYAQEMLAKQFEEIRENPSLVNKLREDLRQIFFPFSQLEHIRISLAKHEVPRNKNLQAYAPGYARIDRHCGSLSYELENDGAIFGYVCRRDIADGLRALSDRSRVPTDEEIKAYKEAM